MSLVKRLPLGKNQSFTQHLIETTANTRIGSSKIGAPVSVNGTDFIFLDECTGLVKTYDLAQDNLNRYHQFGYTSIPV